jgi:hypothetical protein
MEIWENDGKCSLSDKEQKSVRLWQLVAIQRSSGADWSAKGPPSSETLSDRILTGQAAKKKILCMYILYI